MNWGSKWPINGADIARNTLGSAILGPGPNNILVDGFRSVYVVMRAISLKMGHLSNSLDQGQL